MYIDKDSARDIINKRNVMPKVTVNGTDITQLCIFADDVLGLAVCFVQDGNLVKVNETQDELVTEELRGKVEISFIPIDMETKNV